MQRVLVVGAGVVGLTCAVRLAESGRRVDVLARELPQETTSTVAAALWYPYRALPQNRVTDWSAASYDAFARLAEDPESGVRMLPGTEVLREPSPDPWWVDAVPRLERVRPPGGYPDAWSFVAPVIDTPVYLRWLARRLQAAGGTITRMAVPALPQAPLVVNCSGLGARLLGRDPSVAPVRGQVLLVEQWGLERWWLDGAGLTYVVPRGRHVVVGGSDEEGDWNLGASPTQAAAIRERARRLVPELEEARVVRHVVGLRPARPVVRLEAERFGERTVVHCYGHGGAGVTLSWGCADEVAGLVAGADEPA